MLANGTKIKFNAFTQYFEVGSWLCLDISQIYFGFLPQLQRTAVVLLFR